MHGLDVLKANNLFVLVVNRWSRGGLGPRGGRNSKCEGGGRLLGESQARARGYRHLESCLGFQVLGFSEVEGEGRPGLCSLVWELWLAIQDQGIRVWGKGCRVEGRISG
jgi:hypothetical protein